MFLIVLDKHDTLLDLSKQNRQVVVVICDITIRFEKCNDGNYNSPPPPPNPTFKFILPTLQGKG